MIPHLLTPQTRRPVASFIASGEESGDSEFGDDVDGGNDFGFDSDDFDPDSKASARARAGADTDSGDDSDEIAV